MAFCPMPWVFIKCLQWGKCFLQLVTSLWYSMIGVKKINECIKSFAACKGSWFLIYLQFLKLNLTVLHTCFTCFLKDSCESTIIPKSLKCDTVWILSPSTIISGWLPFFSILKIHAVQAESCNAAQETLRRIANQNPQNHNNEQVENGNERAGERGKVTK